MEINIKNESLSVCRCVCRTKNKFTAECDVIVPDSKPDILKILQLSAHPKITNCETKNDRVTVTGTISFTILYLSDDEEKCVKSITSSCEFSNVIRDDNIKDNMLTFADVDISELGANLANCRKITFKASLCMSTQVYSCFELELISDIENACTKTQSLSSSVICAHAQDTSTLTDSFSLPQGKPPICEILKVDGNISDSEIKVIDNKAVIKGNMCLTVLYKSEKGIEYTKNEIPFAHILEADGIREDMDTQYIVKLTEIHANSANNSDGQPCIIDFTADFLFRVIARCTNKINCVVDAFLPHGRLECKHSTVCVDSIETVVRQNADIREKITLPDSFPPISSVYQVNVRPFVESCTVQEEGIHTSGYAEVSVLYLSDDESSPVYSYKTNIDFSVVSDSPGCMLTPVCECTLKNSSYTINSENCIELRSTLDVSVQCIRTAEATTVYSADVGEYVPEKRPSIIVSCLCSDRKLWDIAKEYSVSPESILSANALESENDISSDIALIIPK